MSDLFDLAIVGAGPAGLAALIAAAEASDGRARMAIIDSRPQPGGQYYLQPPPDFQPPARESFLHHRAEAQAWFARASACDADWLLDTDVWGITRLDDAGWQLHLRGRDALRCLSARGVILAVGAYDRPIPFPGWTLPGVMTAGAAQNLLKSQGLLPGRSIVVSGSGPLALAVAANMAEAGARVAAFLHAAPRLIRRSLRHLPALWGQWARLREGHHYWRVLRHARVPIRLGWAAAAAHGEGELRAVRAVRLGPDWRPLPGAQNTETFEADALIVGYGFTPAVQLSRLAGCRHVFDPRSGNDAPAREADMASSQPGLWIAGDGAGIGGAALAQIEGQIAGIAAMRDVGYAQRERAEAQIGRLRGALRREQRFAALLAALFTPGPAFYTLAQDDTLMCRCENVPRSALVAAAQDGAQTINEVKGLTRAGMGLCQGRMCAEAVAQVMRAARQSGYSPPPAALDPDLSPAATPRAPLWPLTLDELRRPVETVEPGRR